MTIYDGETVSNNQLARLTGASLGANHPVTASGSKVLINFETDGGVTKQGFEIRFDEG